MKFICPALFWTFSTILSFALSLAIVTQWHQIPDFPPQISALVSHVNADHQIPIYINPIYLHVVNGLLCLSNLSTCLESSLVLRTPAIHSSPLQYIPDSKPESVRESNNTEKGPLAKTHQCQTTCPIYAGLIGPCLTHSFPCTCPSHYQQHHQFCIICKHINYTNIRSYSIYLCI